MGALGFSAREMSFDIPESRSCLVEFNIDIRIGDKGDRDCE
jgi:hypothetical protein